MACASLYSGGGGLKTLDDLLPVETRVHLRPYDSNYQNDTSRELGLPKNHSTRPATRNTTARGELDWIFDTSSLADTFLSIPSHWKDKEWSQLVEFLIYNRFRDICEELIKIFWGENASKLRYELRFENFWGWKNTYKIEMIQAIQILFV